LNFNPPPFFKVALVQFLGVFDQLIIAFRHLVFAGARDLSKCLLLAVIPKELSLLGLISLKGV